MFAIYVRAQEGWMDMNFVLLVLLLIMWKVIGMLGNIQFVQEQCLHIQLSSSFFKCIFRRQKVALLQLNTKKGKKTQNTAAACVSSSVAQTIILPLLCFTAGIRLFSWTAKHVLCSAVQIMQKCIYRSVLSDKLKACLCFSWRDLFSGYTG